MKKRDIRQKKLMEENKKKYKKFLDMQIEEKKERLQEEENYIRGQADIWKEDEEKFKTVHLERENHKIQNKLQYK